ncbi:DJ-1/PfpI family protein [Zavarzinia sp. CC-PAN008]|uniref:DJ-1/PfpI family protein n=1 Tax=Zavarzinia sp. CC-PAN008 TaxID=3243332 RepID=UPI003F74A0E9
MMNRRELGVLGGSALLALSAVPLSAQSGPTTPVAEAAPAPDHPMPAGWMGREQVAIVLYPQLTALDVIGPHHMFTSLMGATVHMVAATREPVTSDNGLILTPTATFDDCPADLDILCIGGGTAGTLAAMESPAMMAFLKDRGARAKWVTSVCTGSLILGAAGLLKGYRATSHWAAHDLLDRFGAVPTHGRIVTDRNRMTGGGVTAGIDMGLAIVGALRDRTYAESVQLLAEYDPQPPFDSGSPDKASPQVRGIMDSMFVNFLAQARAVADRTGAPWRG